MDESHFEEIARYVRPSGQEIQYSVYDGWVCPSCGHFYDHIRIHKYQEVGEYFAIAED